MRRRTLKTLSRLARPKKENRWSGKSKGFTSVIMMNLTCPSCGEENKTPLDEVGCFGNDGYGNEYTMCWCCLHAIPTGRNVWEDDEDWED